MSLINQMLRDLDHRSRKQDEPGARVATVGAPATRSRIGRVAALVFFALVAAGATGGAWWYFHTGAATDRDANVGPPPDPAGNPVAGTVTPAAEDTAETAAAQQEASAAAATDRPAEKGGTSRGGEQAAPAESWVRDFSVASSQGGQVLRMTVGGDRPHRLFTLPDPHRIVLDIRDVDRAENWADALDSLEGVTGARADLRPGERLRIVLEVPSATAFDLSTQTRDDGRRDLALRINPPAADPPPVAATPEPAAESPGPAAETGREAPVKTKASSEPAGPDNVKRRLSPDELADRAYHRGHEAMRASRTREAETRFREALKHRPRFGDARRALIGVLDRQGRWDSILSVAREGMRLGSDRAYYAKVHARVTLERGDLEGAIATLRRHRNADSVDSEYLSLLAALYRRAGRHAEAAAVYRELLAGGPSRGVWWMGLGLSLEALERPGEALDAYRRAGEAGDLPSDVSDYVAARIDALSETGEKP